MVERITLSFVDDDDSLDDLNEEERARYAVIEKELPDYSDLIKFCRAIKRDVKKDFDCVIIVTGEREGIGKSTFAMMCARILDPYFELERNVIFDPSVQAVKDRVEHLPKYSPVVFDEAIKILFNREWYSKLNIFLNKYYKITRKFNQISFMCIPDVFDVDPKFLQTKVLFWVHLIDRGHGVVRMRDWVSDCRDKWHFDENAKKMIAMSSKMPLFSTTAGDKQRIYGRLRNYVGSLSYPDLPADLKAEYRELSMAASKDFELNLETKVEAKYKNALLGALKLFGAQGLDVNAVAEATGLSEFQVRRFMKEKELKTVRQVQQDEAGKPENSRAFFTRHGGVNWTARRADE